MTSSVTIGTPGAANEAIGGIPSIHYFDLQSRGRGQVVRILWEDAGIAYQDIRYPLGPEFQQYRDGVIGQMNPLKTLPIVELNGKILTQSYAILRHMARLLGSYEGENEDEKYWTDVICDIGVDCMLPTLFFGGRLTIFDKGGHSLWRPFSVPQTLTIMPPTRRPT